VIVTETFPGRFSGAFQAVDRLMVVDEWATLRWVRDGRKCLARYGDGEIKLMMGQWTKGQDEDLGLAKQLRRIAQEHAEHTVVAIPRIYDHLPKHKREFWERYTTPDRTRFFDEAHIYGSSFVSRPDHFPKLNTPDYWDLWRSLWDGRPALLVKGTPEGQETKRPALFDSALSLETVAAPPVSAWAEYEALFRRCLTWGQTTPDGIVLLCVGATATVLAYRLGAVGVQAVDVGHTPGYYAKRGELARGEKHCSPT
jgi:hypothetical protein